MKKIFVTILMMLSLYQANAQKIVGYLPSYRDPSTTNIQYAKVNTIIYAFINPNTTGNLITTSGAGAAWDFNMTHFLTVKTNCATYGTKLSISLGGADAGSLRSSRLSAVCGNNTYRATLVSELVQFAITHNLYGIDVDWEFPTNTTDKNRHEALLADLDAAIAASGNPNIKIGVAVGGEYSGSIHHLNYFNNNAVQYVDDFHIMAYDFPASYDANNHASLTDAQNSFNTWSTNKSIPKSKMYMGVPFYGRNASRSIESDYRSFSAGAASYNVDAYSGYYYNGKTTLETKAQWVVDQGGQGIMIWDLGQDRTDTYSLLNVLYTKMSTICPAPQPNLGPDIGFCTGSVVLDGGVPQAAGRTFSWKKDGAYVVTNSLTANTHTTSAGGTFILEVTQSACTKTDQIVVTAGSSLGVTNATRCGPGSVTLGVNASSGTYDWYAASSGGTALHTGLNYTFSETASATYYVQENTGSSTYNGGKAVINLPAAWNEAGYDGTLPRHAHKMVVTTDLTIQSVKIWTSNNATTGVKVMILKSDGLTVHDQTAAVNLPTGGGPYTITVNKTLVAGTYFVGLYAPVPGGPTNNGIYLESNSNFPTSQAGVYSIEGKSYANYGTGFAATQTPTHYGQLFDWVITTGVVPPCGRTAVTTTINSAANIGLTVTGTTPICPGVDGSVIVQNSESNVSYQAYIGANTAGPAINGNGANVTVTVNNASLSAGSNTITIKGTKTGCGTVSLTNTASITVNASASAATITFGNITKTYGDAAFNLSATSASSGAFTYSLQGSTPGSIVTVTSAGLATITGAGSATLKVDQAAAGCYPANSTTATLTINKATLTVTATNQSRLYGAANATAVFTYSGFVNSETSSVIDAAPTAAHTATSGTAVGTAAINVSGGSDNNYTFSYVSGTLTINKATITATADAKSRAYGDVNPTFTFTYTGFVNSETSSVIDVPPTASTTATTTTSPGGYAITAAGGSDNNYNITLVNGTLTITKANRVVTITSASTGTAGGSINLTFTTNPSGGSATWSRTNGTGTASVSGSTLSLTTIGTVTVQVDIAADVNYNATSNTQVVTISNLTTPSITFNGTTKTFGDAVFTMAATSNSAGAFTYSLISSVPSGIVTVATNGQITINGAGTATVKVDQAADGSFGPGSGTASITINKANRTASITSVNTGLAGGTITLTNTVSGGTNTPVWSVTNATGSANLNTNILTLVVAGTVNVQVDIAADANYNAASANQTITISTATSVSDALSGSSFSVYPNPYETVSAVHFELSNSAPVKLEVYDLSGHKIETLLDGATLSGGSYEVALSNLSMGTYMLKLQIGSFEKNIKVVKN